MPVTRKASATLGNEPLSRTSSTPSTPTPSSKKKNGTSASASNGPSAKDTTSTPTISRAKSKEVIAREFVDPPKVIGNSPLKQTPSRTFVVAGPPSPNPKKSKKSTAQQKKLSSAKAASSGLWASVRYTIMVGLVTYTVVICPHDKKNDLALCRTKTDAERAWKRHIYEPYLEPRFNDLLAHPSVSRVVDPVIHHTKPVSRQVHSFLNQRSQNVYRNYLMYSALAERELHKHSQPYVKQVQRQYNTHLDPYVSQYITPTYNNHIIPVIQRMEVWGRATGRMLEPYLYRAAITIRRAAHQTEPVLAVLWSYAADVPGAIHQRAWEPLVDLRRTYVDPQVSKMMETVDEVGGEAKAAADEHVTAPTAETVEKPHDTPSETIASEPPTPTPTLPPTPLESLVDSEVTLTSDPPEQAAGSNKDFAGEDVDLEAFLHELGVGDAQAEAEPAVPELVETVDVEEMERQRMQLTADRRSEILRRHAEWERQVKEMSDARLEAFPEILGRLRVEESSDLVNAKHADAMTRDADKALKNMEAFVRKLISGSEDGRTTHEEKVVLLENVVSKVKQRFEDGASVMTGQVVAWLENAQRKELDEIERLVMDVRDLGTTAQGDLGLGYAWLDDVTIQDWARYHGLLDAATDLQAKLTNLASGSDPASPKNVLSEAMRDLQLDLETVVLRFRSDLSAVHQRGLEAIHRGNLSGANPHHTTITSGEPTMSILPINDGPADQVVDPQSVVLGKSREQVEEAVAWEMANEARAHAEL